MCRIWSTSGTAPGGFRRDLNGLVVQMVPMDSRGQVVLEVRLVGVLLDERLMPFRVDVIRIHILRGDSPYRKITSRRILRHVGHVLGLPEQVNESGDTVSETANVSLNNCKLPEGFLQYLVVLVIDKLMVPSILLDLEELGHMHAQLVEIALNNSDLPRVIRVGLCVLI